MHWENGIGTFSLKKEMLVEPIEAEDSLEQPAACLSLKEWQGLCWYTVGAQFMHAEHGLNQKCVPDFAIHKPPEELI